MNKTVKEKSQTVRVSKETSLKLEQEADVIIRKANIKKYGFPKTKVHKLLIALYKKRNGKLNMRNEYKFASGYCSEKDNNFPEVNAIIKLMEQYHPNEMVCTKFGNGKSVLIIGDVAKELFEKSKIDWSGAHVSTAGVKVPISFKKDNKMKSFGGHTISSKIKKSKTAKN